MSKLFNSSLLLLLSILCISVLSGCSMFENALLGYWMSDDGAILHFVSDSEVYVGTYSDSEEKVHCSYILLDGDKISYRVNDTVYVYKFDVNKNEQILTLYSGSDDNQSVVDVYYGADYMQEEIVVGLTIKNR